MPNTPLNNFVDTFDGFVANVMAQTAQRVHQAVTLATPVDTGNARSNWVVSVSGSPSRRVRRPYSPGNGLGRGETQNLNASIQAANRELVKYTNPKVDIHINNNVDYVVKLNDEGSSPQADIMFIQTAIIKAVNSIKKIRIVVQ